MPTNDVVQLTEEQKMRIRDLSFNTEVLRAAQLAIEPLYSEANGDYAKSMNKIIFDKYLNESPEEILSGNNLILPEDPDVLDEVPYQGLIQLSKNDETREFSTNFKEFCLNSLYTKKEVLSAMDQLTAEAAVCRNLALFQFTFQEPVRLEEFRSQQEAAKSACLYHLKNTWISNITQIVKGEFASIEKGWFSLQETNKNSYE
jgi:dynein heavy chain